MTAADLTSSSGDVDLGIAQEEQIHSHYTDAEMDPLAQSLLRRRAEEKERLFQETLPQVREDVDLGVRLRNVESDVTGLITVQMAQHHRIEKLEGRAHPVAADPRPFDPPKEKHPLFAWLEEGREGKPTPAWRETPQIEVVKLYDYVWDKSHHILGELLGWYDWNQKPFYVDGLLADLWNEIELNGFEWEGKVRFQAVVEAVTKAVRYDLFLTRVADKFNRVWLVDIPPPASGLKAFRGAKSPHASSAPEIDALLRAMREAGLLEQFGEVGKKRELAAAVAELEKPEGAVEAILSEKEV